MMSVPPDVAPNFTMIPTPAPISTPPNMAATSKLSEKLKNWLMKEVPSSGILPHEVRHAVHDERRDERGEYRFGSEGLSEYDKADYHQRNIHHQTECTRLYRRHKVMEDAPETVNTAGDYLIGIGEEHEPGRHYHGSDHHPQPREPEFF